MNTRLQLIFIRHDIHTLLAIECKSESDVQKIVDARRRLRNNLVEWQKKQKIQNLPFVAYGLEDNVCQSAYP